MHLTIGPWTVLIVRTVTEQPTVAVCEVCHGDGYVHIDADENSTLDWIMRCDECEAFQSDEDAADHAARVEGKTVRWAMPLRRSRPLPFLC